MSKIYEALLRAEQDRVAAKETVPSITNIKTVYSAPEVPVIPITVSEPRSELSSVLRAVPSAAESSNLVEIPTYQWTPSLAQLPALENRGGAVEQFRSLRSRLQELREIKPLKSILISSGLPQEGKSFVAANLAISLARHKASRVLLIDGDMRRSSLHRLLGAPHAPGLTEYLAGNATISQIIRRAQSAAGSSPLPADLASLTFIGGGIDSDKAADLSGNPRFTELITTLAPQFDWIIVDSSPVNLVTDGVNLARACDGVLLVARGDVTRYQSIQRAISELKASNILGVVLNAVSKLPVASGYYGYDSEAGPTEK